MPPIVLHVSSEVSPFHKSGGLGDVLAGLPPALARQGIDCRVVTGLFGQSQLRSLGSAAALKPWPTKIALTLAGNSVQATVYEARTHNGLVTTYFVSTPILSREKLYGYDDDVYRFALLSKAASVIGDVLTYRHPDSPVEAIHAHDWHAALAVYYARRTSNHLRNAATLFTIHNLAYQGLVERSSEPYLDISAHDGQYFFEERGVVNLMKGAILSADAVTTVSPNYAREIQTERYGQSLDGLLRYVSGKLHGITNGIDQHTWNPERDSALAMPFHYLMPQEDIEGARELGRASLRWELGLATPPREGEIPLFGVVTRLTHQKGIDLLCEIASQVVSEGAQLAILGEGDRHLEDRLAQLAFAHRGMIGFRRAFNDGLARRIYGASDFYIMPSRFEPCGLAQLYAMRYGSIPIARATGGLVDTIRPVTDHHHVQSATGILFPYESPQALLDAIRYAKIIFRDRAAYFHLRANGMHQDFSWDSRAHEYIRLYEHLGVSVH